MTPEEELKSIRPELMQMIIKMASLESKKQCAAIARQLAAGKHMRKIKGNVALIAFANTLEEDIKNGPTAN